MFDRIQLYVCIKKLLNKCKFKEFCRFFVRMYGDATVQLLEGR